jgi:PH (Pleckstrin Homology) domain-containing protein
VTGDRIYRSTQIAWPTITPLMVVAGILVPIFIRAELTAGPWIVAAVYGVILLLFATLTVTVTSDGVGASFGIGLIRTGVPFSEVVSFARVQTRWTEGWGIHSYPGGTLYNASGSSAVEFKLSSGRSVTIGTSEPDALVAAVQQATGKQEASHEARVGPAWGRQQTVAVVASALAVMLAAFGVYTTVQPPTAIVGFDSLYVSNGFYRNTIPFASMRSVTLEDQLPRIGIKTSGSAIRNRLRGNFLVDTWGRSRLYVNLDAPPFIVIQAADDHIAINFADAARTRQLYSELKSHAGRSDR